MVAKWEVSILAMATTMARFFALYGRRDRWVPPTSVRVLETSQSRADDSNNWRHRSPDLVANLQLTNYPHWLIVTGFSPLTRSDESSRYPMAGQEIGGMKLATQAPVVAAPGPNTLVRQMTWWVLALPIAMVVALSMHNLYLLDYTHVMAGCMWTGADLFLGFILGPVMKRLSPPQRKAVIGYLTPRTLLYMPMVSLTTGTAGWYMAHWVGYLAPTNPIHIWVYGALVITGILTVQGLGFLLPNNLRIWRELQRPEPDGDRIWRWNRQNLMLSGVQGVLQVVIILVMAHLVVG